MVLLRIAKANTDLLEAGKSYTISTRHSKPGSDYGNGKSHVVLAEITSSTISKPVLVTDAG